ncbi:hypothetical protein D3C76_36700 [compost metagenome]
MNQNIFDAFDDVSMESLERMARTISMEHGVPDFNKTKMKDRGAQFFRAASSFFNKMKFTALSISGLTPKDLEGFVAKVGFVAASNKPVIVPESFTGQWVPYSEALKKAMNDSTKLEYMLRSFCETLGRITHDPSLLTAVSGIGHQGPSGLGLTIQMQDIGKTFFDGKSNHITRMLGSVVDRQVDIRATFNNLNDIAALDKAHPAKKAMDAVDRAMTLADGIMAAVQAAIADKSISNQEAVDIGIQELVDLTLLMAKEMESYGTLLFRVRQFSEAMKDSMREIRK